MSFPNLNLQSFEEQRTPESSVHEDENRSRYENKSEFQSKQYNFPRDDSSLMLKGVLK